MSYCKRHKWRVMKQSPLRKNTPTGRPSNAWGVWQVRCCSTCGALDGRWMPGVNESSVEAARNQVAAKGE